MAIHRESEIGRRHAAAIVGDADPPPAAAVGENVDPAGAGVDGIFHQFLDHARRPLDHLARGDAVDDLFGKLADGHRVRDSRRWGGDVRAKARKSMQRDREIPLFHSIYRRHPEVRAAFGAPRRMEISAYAAILRGSARRAERLRMTVEYVAPSILKPARAAPGL